MIEDATLEPFRARGYELGGFLGSGAFSEVISATQTSTGAQVAIKRVTGGGADAAAFAAAKRRSVRLPIDDGGSNSMVLQPPLLAPPPAPGAREAAALRELRGHPNVIQLLEEVELFDDHAPPTSTALVLERAHIDAVTLLRYAPSVGGGGGGGGGRGGESDGEGEGGFFVGGGVLDPSLAKALVRGVLSAVGALSRRRIAHRDIKPGNVLLTRDGRVALADLGLAARWPAKNEGEGGEEIENENEASTSSSLSRCPLSHRPLPPAGTRWYRPPEALYGGPADAGPGADLWGAGCILAEALGLSAPLAAGETDLDQVSRVAEVLGGPPDPSEWPGVVELPDFAALASVAESYYQKEGGEGEGGGGEGEGAGGEGEGEASRSSSRSPPPRGGGGEGRGAEPLPRNNLASRLPDAPPSAVALLSTLLSYDPGKRGTAEEALAHAYFHEPPLPAPRERVRAAVAAAAAARAAERKRASRAQQRRRRKRQQQNGADVVGFL